MNIRMLTLAERERLAYIGDHPDKELLAGLMDAEQELVEVGEELRTTENYLYEAEEELDSANAKLNDIRDMVDA
jgi:septal ring factor EnvC (AmiA/AmiB activator)